MTATVLLIDDSATTRSILKVYLTGLDVAYLEAPDAATALGLLMANRVHIVIADINMPGMDGLTMLKAIRDNAVAAIRNVPVVVLTGDKNEDTRRRGFEAGANSFVNKPVSATELRAAVLRWIPQAEVEKHSSKSGGDVLPFPSARRG